LIGAYWIAVILLLAAAYSCLYVMSHRAEKGKAWGWIGLIALVITLKIGVIYSSNMTLMLRPDVWREMYRADGLGGHLNTGDPTVWPRWLFLMFGGLSVGGVGLMLLGMTPALSAEAGAFLRRWGGRLVAAGVVVQGVCGGWLLAVVPAAVRSGLFSSGLYIACFVAWIVCAALLLAAGVVGQRNAATRAWRWPALAGGAAFLHTVVAAVFRGGIRDTALAGFGYDVWNREVAANWVVVLAFLLSFVVGLGAVAWLTSVVFRMEKVEERYA
jgi:hypothetical protein